MFSNLGLRNLLAWLVFVAIVMSLIIFAENIYKNQRCKSVDIQLESDIEGHFITKSEINKLLTNNGNYPILGSKFNILNFKNLEQKVLANKLVKSCQISRSWAGVLSVKIGEENPIARIVSLSGSSEKFAGLYVGDEGKLFPLSKNFTKRVVLLSGKYLIGKKGLVSEKDQNLLTFLLKINRDEFWNANITHIIIDDDQNLQLLPLISNVTFDFGQPIPDQIDQKLNKIKIYYNNIEPENYDKYKMISVKYQNQIVCQLKQPPNTENIEKIQ